MLAELFQKVITSYPACRATENFKGNPMGPIVRRELVNEISKTHIIVPPYTVKGSIGNGNWATVPWIAVLDTRITTSTQSGVYIVYLFSEDGESLYLTLNQGCTEFVSKLGRLGSVKEMNRISADIRGSIFTPTGFTADNNISLGNVLYEQGCIFYKKYVSSNMPDDVEMLDDLERLLTVYSLYFASINVNAMKDGCAVEQIITPNSYNITALIERNTAMFKKWLHEKKKYSVVTVENILSRIDVASDFAADVLKYNKKILSIKDADEIETLKKRLIANPEFREMNKRVSNFYLEAIDQYFSFLRKNAGLFLKSGKKISLSATEVLFDGKALDIKYKPLVSAFIADGITTTAQVQVLNILRYLNEKGLYDFKTRMQILDEVNRLFGIPINVKKQIPEAVRCIPVDEVTGNQKSSRGMRDEQVLGEVEKYLKQQLQGACLEDILIFKPSVRSGTLRRLLSSTAWAVNIRDRYMHRDNLYGFNDFADTVLSVLKSLFEKNGGHATAFMLFNAVRARLEYFFYDNGCESALEVYDLAQHLFEKERYIDNYFIFYNSTHIWEKEPDYPKSYVGLFIKWARENSGIISRDQCCEKLEMIGASNISANFSNTYHNAKELLWQFESYRFVLSEKIQVDEQWKLSMHSRLSELLKGAAFVPLRDIADYWFETLPQLPTGVYWTPLLLQEIITYIDVGFRTIPAGDGQDSDAVHAAIVPNDSPIETFGDVVWRVVDEDFQTPTSELYTEQLRQALVRRNILQGNERIWSLPKAIGDDLRFRWIADNTKVIVFNI